MPSQFIVSGLASWIPLRMRFYSRDIFRVFCLLCCSIRPSVITHLSEVRSRWQQAKEGIPDLPLSSNTSQFLLGDLKAFPGWLRHTVPQSIKFWVCPGGLLPDGPGPGDTQDASSPEPSQLGPWTSGSWTLFVPGVQFFTT